MNADAEYLRELAEEAPGNYREGLLKAAEALDTRRPTGVVDLRPGGDDARVVAAETEAHRLRGWAGLMARDAFDRQVERDEARAALAALRERIEAKTAHPIHLDDTHDGCVPVRHLRALLADTAGAPRTDAS